MQYVPRLKACEAGVCSTTLKRHIIQKGNATATVRKEWKKNKHTKFFASKLKYGFCLSTWRKVINWNGRKFSLFWKTSWNRKAPVIVKLKAVLPRWPVHGDIQLFNCLFNVNVSVCLPDRLSVLIMFLFFVSEWVPCLATCANVCHCLLVLV